MTPFNIRIKQENRDYLPYVDVAYVQYVEINLNGTEYRLMKLVNNVIQFTINGRTTTTPYFDKANQISAVMSGGRLWFNTGFSLNIAWDGDNRVDISLCNSYSKYVCGLCGNADGIASNDYVDRLNRPFSLVGTKFTMYFDWGSLYRVMDDSIASIDLNNST